MNRRFLWIALAIVLGPGVTPAHATEPLYSEGFDGQAVKPGQSLLDGSLSWQRISPNDPGRNRVGNVFLGAGKYGWTGNYLDGATAAVAEAENVFHKTFPAANTGKIVLSCKAFAAAKTSEGSAITLRPAQPRFFNRGGGWRCTPLGWEFFVACADAGAYPLDERTIGPLKVLTASLKGGHDVTVELATTVDLDHNKAWGQASWKDANGRVRKFKSPLLNWDSAAGNLACVKIDIDKRSGHTGIAVDDLRVEGEAACPKPHPFKQGDRHVVRQLNGQQQPVSLPAEIGLLDRSQNDAQCPSMVYMPEKNRVVMLVSTQRPAVSGVIFSDDRGKAWSKRQWLSVDGNGKPTGSMMVGLTYLGGGRLLAFPGTVNTCWHSDDFGKTWKGDKTTVGGEERYIWDAPLIARRADGSIECMAHGCWHPTGIPWGSAEAPYSQAYFLSTADEGKTWNGPTKIPQWLGVNEVSMVVAKNGDYVAACRTDPPKRLIHHQLDHFCGFGVSISKDQGKTWSDVRSLYELGRHHPSMVLLPDGRIAMTYVARLGYPNTADGFPQFGVEAVVSRDNGQTWDLEHRYILAEWAGNLKGEDFWHSGVQSSSTVLLPDQSLLTAFGTGFDARAGRPGPDDNLFWDVATVHWRM